MNHLDTSSKYESLGVSRLCTHDQQQRQMERDHLAHQLLRTGSIEVDGHSHSLWEVFGEIEHFEALQKHLLTLYNDSPSDAAVIQLQQFLLCAAREVAFEIMVMYRGRQKP